MLVDVLVLLAGLALLLLGGDQMVRGASALAGYFRVSPLLIGMTVVSLGTSAPELTVNLLAALQNNAELSFGNIIGSNLANIGLVLGLSAVLRPLPINRLTITRDVPIMLMVSLLVLIMGMDTMFRNSVNSFDRSEGIILLLFFCVFIYYSVNGIATDNAPIYERKVDLTVNETKRFLKIILSYSPIL